jgi:hypothetical protein
MNDAMLYVGSVAIIVWGIAHIVPIKPVVRDFGPISQDNKQIITMEWLAEGLALCFVGLLVMLVTIWDGSQNPVSLHVYRISAVMLLVMAALTLVTGARTSIVAMKICPFVKTTVAVLFFLGSTL